MDDQLDARFRLRRMGLASDPPDERATEERRHYTTRLQRRARAHVTAELGGGIVVPDLDRQIISVLQHAQDATKARRVTFYRPIDRGRRWHVATLLPDRGFFYGLVTPESLGWPRQTAEEKRRLLVARGDEPEGDRLRALGLRSYLSVPVLVAESTVAVMEAIDIAEPDQLDHYAGLLEAAVAGLGQRLAAESKAPEIADPGSTRSRVSPDSVLDLVLRQPYEVDESFEVRPGEWAVLNHLNGERPLSEVARLGGISVAQASAVANVLVERGLVRFGHQSARVAGAPRLWRNAVTLSDAKDPRWLKHADLGQWAHATGQRSARSGEGRPGPAKILRFAQGDDRRPIDGPTDGIGGSGG